VAIREDGQRIWSPSPGDGVGGVKASEKLSSCPSCRHRDRGAPRQRRCQALRHPGQSCPRTLWRQRASLNRPIGIHSIEGPSQLLDVGQGPGGA
jgi:hypothetical protein